MKKTIYIILIVFLFIISGCIEKKVYNDTSTIKREYPVYAVDKFPKSLVSLDSNNIEQQDMMLCLFEGLVSMDENGKIVPALSSDWTISQDGLTYVFNIRENAKWSDGSYITAEDFENFFEKILIQEKNIYIDQLKCIFGVKDYIDKKVDFTNVAIVAKDDLKLEIRLNHPDSYFLKVISHPIFSLRENFHNLENWEDEYKKIKYSGPFVIEDIYMAKEVYLKKNKEYWNSKNISIDRINIKKVESSDFALADYKYGKIDIFSEIPINEIDNLKGEEKVLQGPSLKGISLNFNLNKDGIIKNNNFRKALGYCIDRENIEKEFKGVFKGSMLYIPDNVMKSDDFIQLKDLKYNNAKELLDKSGYKGEKIRVIYDSHDTGIKSIAKYIVQDMKKLGVNVLEQEYEDEDLDNLISKGEYDIFITDYNEEFLTPLPFLEKWLMNSKFNVYGYKNSEFDKYVLKGNRAKNLNESVQSFKKAQKILLQDAAFIPIGFYNRTLCKKDHIEGIYINQKGNIILKNLYKN